MTKCKAAKGKDKVRSGWEQRYFALSGKILKYYKRQGDSTPKGEINLEHAKIDDADAKTGKNHSIRVEQAKQVFVYLVAGSHDDKLDWISALRKAAGYPEGEWDITAVVAPVAQPKNFANSLCSFAALLVQADGSQPHRTIVIADTDGSLCFANEKLEVYKKFQSAEIQSVTASSSPDVRLATTSGVSDLYSLDLKFLTAQGGFQYKFYLGSQEVVIIICLFIY